MTPAYLQAAWARRHLDISADCDHVEFKDGVTR